MSTPDVPDLPGAPAAGAQPALPAIEVATKTDPGRDPAKQINEDTCGYRETRFGHLAVVCDGMGGHAGGREAAEIALATIFDVFDREPAGTPPADVLRAAIVAANRNVYGMEPAGHDDGRPGSTVVTILLHAHGTEVAHVGDSRCYLVHGAQVFQVTKDHSMVQRLVDAQMLSPAEAASHPDANKILRALGSHADVDVDLRPQPIRHAAGDLFVLCSDGLSDLVEPEDILRASGSGPALQAAGQLVNLANARGGHDNITAVLVRVKTAARTQPTKVAQTIAEGPAGVPMAPLFADAQPVGGTAATPAKPPAPTQIREAAPLPTAVPGGVHRGPAARGSEPPSASLRGMPPALIAGLALAVLGIGIALTAIYVTHRERGGHEHPPGPQFDLTSLEAGPSQPVELTAAPTPLPTFDADASAAAPLPTLTPIRPVYVPRLHPSAPPPLPAPTK